MYTRRYNIMKKRTKIALGFGVAGLSGIGIFTILRQKKLAKQAFDAEFDEAEAVEEAESSASENDPLPEFTEYTGISVGTVTDMLNEVTHKYTGFNKYYIKASDFEEIRKKLGVYQIFIRDNYEIIQFSNERNVGGEMITFRIKEGYSVSNDGWFIIEGRWTYLSKDDTRDDYIRCAQGKERDFVTDECFIK
jgi:hypothetical protein